MQALGTEHKRVSCVHVEMRVELSSSTRSLEQIFDEEVDQIARLGTEACQFFNWLTSRKT